MKIRNHTAALVAIAAGAIAIALIASQRSQRSTRRPRDFYDYSNRSGFPQWLDASRGLASDFEVPADFRTPEALRPYAH
jgi:hypothetical protein